MNRTFWFSGSIILVLTLCGIAVRSSSRPAEQSSTDKERIERGRYIVEQESHPCAFAWGWQVG